MGFLSGSLKNHTIGIEHGGISASTHFTEPVEWQNIEYVASFHF